MKKLNTEVLVSEEVKLPILADIQANGQYIRLEMRKENGVNFIYISKLEE